MFSVICVVKLSGPYWVDFFWKMTSYSTLEPLFYLNAVAVNKTVHCFFSLYWTMHIIILVDCGIKILNLP